MRILITGGTGFASPTWAKVLRPSGDLAYQMGPHCTVRRIRKYRMAKSFDNGFSAHPSACVESDAVGHGTQIWHFTHVMAGSSIGTHCTLGQNVFIATGVHLGNGVKVQNNVSLYAGITVEDDVFLGPSCVLTNITNPRSQLTRRHQYETTRLRRGCTLGANSTIVCGVTIGRYAFIAAGAVVTRDVADYALIVGVPGRPVGFMSCHGQRLAPPDAAGLCICPQSGWRYQYSPDGLTCLDFDPEAPLPQSGAPSALSYADYRRQTAANLVAIPPT